MWCAIYIRFKIQKNENICSNFIKWIKKYKPISVKWLYTCWGITGNTEKKEEFRYPFKKDIWNKFGRIFKEDLRKLGCGYTDVPYNLYAAVNICNSSNNKHNENMKTKIANVKLSDAFISILTTFTYDLSLSTI